jgi:hypothetical protein
MRSRRAMNRVRPQQLLVTQFANESRLPKPRLMALSYAEQARRLAQAKSLILPYQEDYSIAEIYCHRPEEPKKNPRLVGFRTDMQQRDHHFANQVLARAS